MIIVLFHLWTNKIKVVYDEQIFMKIRVYLAHEIKVFVLLCNIALFLLKLLIQFVGSKNTLCCHSQPDYHLTHLTGIHRSYLIYFQVYNMLKILCNKNRLNHCIIHWRMLPLVFPYNSQYLTPWKYMGYQMVVC